MSNRMAIVIKENALLNSKLNKLEPLCKCPVFFQGSVFAKCEDIQFEERERITQALSEFANEEDYLMIVFGGDNDGDIEVLGGFIDNPFNLEWAREFKFTTKCHSNDEFIDYRFGESGAERERRLKEMQSQATFKVWVQIEHSNEKSDVHFFTSEPILLGEFLTLESASQFQAGCLIKIDESDLNCIFQPKNSHINHALEEHTTTLQTN